MQPRGQLWFELQRACQDFHAFSGLEPQEALKVMVIVLRNLLAEQEKQLAKLTGAESTATTGSSDAASAR